MEEPQNNMWEAAPAQGSEGRAERQGVWERDPPGQGLSCEEAEIGDWSQGDKERASAEPRGPETAGGPMRNPDPHAGCGKLRLRLPSGAAVAAAKC